MRTCLTRAEYDAEIRRRLLELVGTKGLESALRMQYPKAAAEALRELWYCGAGAPALPEDRTYTADEVDRLVEAADLVGGA